MAVTTLALGAPTLVSVILELLCLYLLDWCLLLTC